MGIVYQVIATLPDLDVLDEYLAWLQGGHVDQVIAGGAHSAMIATLEGDRPRVMTQYLFSTRADYDRYLHAHAPALREDGVRRFGGRVTFERSLGEIV